MLAGFLLLSGCKFWPNFDQILTPPPSSMPMCFMDNPLDSNCLHEISWASQMWYSQVLAVFFWPVWSWRLENLYGSLWKIAFERGLNYWDYIFVPITVTIFDLFAKNQYFFFSSLKKNEQRLKPIVVLPGNWCLRSDSRRHKCQNSTDASHIRWD